MLIEQVIVVALQGQHRQVDGIAKDDVPYSSVTKRLNVVDDAIYPPSAQLGKDIANAAGYGVGIGVVTILLGE